MVEEGRNQAAIVSLADAQAYCRRVAQGYENFSVASLLLPAQLRQHFYNVYAYCRIADDFADESASPALALAALDSWEAEFNACLAGSSHHPAMVALADTVRRFRIPEQLFRDLLTAFRRDQEQTRYSTHEEVLDYCRCSANPVGRIVLHLAECADRCDLLASDSICTGLQLANFCQDVARDFAMGRVYLPRESLSRFGCNEDQLANRIEDEAFVNMMQFETERAETYLRNGQRLLVQVPSFLRVDLRLFLGGGLAICSEIRKQGYRVLSHRPVVGKASKLALLLRATAAEWFGYGRRGPTRGL